MLNANRVCALVVLSLASLLSPSLVRGEPLRVTATPRRVSPGGVVLVRVRSRDADAKPPVATVGGEKVTLLPVVGGFEAVVPVPIEAPPGPLSVELGADAIPAARAPRVVEAAFKDVAIDVEEIFVDPPAEVRARLDDDNRAVAKAYGQEPGAPLWKSAFTWPRPRRITARFGDLRIFNGTKNSQHLGLDLAGREGAPVRAANDGQVVLAQELFYSGNTVIVHHGAGIYTGYFHLASLDARTGDEVRRGKVVGTVGATGRTTGPHLHFAVRVAGDYVDPESFMRLRWVPRARATERRAGREVRDRRPGSSP